MYIPLTILIAILSFFSAWERIWNFFLKHKKYVSWFFYGLAFVSLYYLTDTSDHAIHTTWERAYDALMLILFLPILAKVFNFSLAKKLMVFRKELWILMWVLAMVHGLQYFLADSAYHFWEISFWIQDSSITHFAYGFIALIITIALTVTSNTLSIKKLWKYWKKIHRFVYVLLFFWVLHVFFFIYGTDEFIPKLLKYGIPLVLYIVWKWLEWNNIQLRK
jgi:DMSO/TMAO reductase YedYZ heme-binding membrane subunit